MSSVEVPLGDLCTLEEEERPVAVLAVNATMHADEKHRTSAKTEFVTSTAAHLELLLSCMDVDNMFAVNLNTSSEDPRDEDEAEACAPEQAVSPPAQSQPYANGDLPHGNGYSTAEEIEEIEGDEVDPERETWKTASEAKKRAFLHASMLWTFQAHQRVKHRSKLSLLTFGALIDTPVLKEDNVHSIFPSVAAAVALSRTLHMESRVSCGTAVDLWPPDAPINIQVRFRAISNFHCATWFIGWAFKQALRMSSLLQVLRSAVERSGEQCVAIHHNRWYGERLVPAPDAVQCITKPTINRTVIVSGGSKGLGLEYTKQVSNMTVFDR